MAFSSYLYCLNNVPMLCAEAPTAEMMRANKMINRFMVESCLVYLCIYDIVNISGIDMSVNLNKRTVFFVDSKDKEVSGTSLTWLRPTSKVLKQERF